MRKFLTIAALLTATPALAAMWQVDPAKSSLTFTGKQAGEYFTGTFPTFTSEIDFDEAAPEKGRIHITVDMASATIDGKDRADALPTADWFGVKTFPTAEFTSTSIRQTPPHHFAATGILSLHGVKKEITLPFTLTTQATTAHAEGSVTLNRSDYHIGQGRWSDDQWIAHPVTVKYTIQATK